MAELLGLIAGGAGLASLAIQLSQAIPEYISQVHSAPREIQTLKYQLEALAAVWKQLEDFLSSSHATDFHFQPDSALSMVILGCEKDLQDLLETFEEKGKGKLSYRTRLRWPLEANRCSKTTARLFQCQEAFRFSLDISHCREMARSSLEVLDFLKEQKASLETLKILPSEMSKALQTVNSVFLAVANTSATTTQLLENQRDLQAEIRTIHKKTDLVWSEIELQRREEILRWISPLEPARKHQDVQSRRTSGTGAWILQHPIYKQWFSKSSSDQNCLCCYGNPGAGKTIIASCIIDRISQLIEASGVQDEALTYLYCDYRDQSPSIVDVIGMLLKQLVASSTSVPKKIIDKFDQEFRGKGRRLLLYDIEDLFSIMCKHFSRVYICIDAIDEQDKYKDILHFLKALSNRVSIVILSRKHVEDDVDRRFPKALKISIEANPGDVRRFVMQKVQEDLEDNQAIMDSTLANNILNKIESLSHGLFILPEMHIKIVLDGKTKADRKRRLDYLPPTLEATFGVMLGRIKEQGDDTASVAMSVFKWVRLAERRLSSLELQHALATEAGSKDLDPDNLMPLSNIMRCCMGLVTVNPRNNTVEFVHYTLEHFFKVHDKRFLSHDNGLVGSQFQVGHEDIARICLTYLMFEAHAGSHWRMAAQTANYMDRSTSRISAGLFKCFALFPYASLHWGDHARNSHHQGSKLGPLILTYLLQDCRRRRISSQLLLQKSILLPRKHGLYSNNYPAPPWAIAARFGLANQYMEHLLDSAELPNINGLNMLDWAAENGHTTIVERLILLGKPMIKSVCQQSEMVPLWLAIRHNHGEVVRLLLPKFELNTEWRWFGLTLLQWAASMADVQLMEMLLKCANINVNSDVPTGQTSLHIAADKGNIEIIRVLLSDERIQVNPRERIYGQTPLSFAVERGRTDIVKLLLDRKDIDTNLRDGSERTALFYAVERGDLRLVQMLLDHGADPMREGYYGDTPLHIAMSFQFRAIEEAIRRSLIKLEVHDEGVTSLAIRTFKIL